MASTKRRNNAYITLGIRVLIIVIVTLILLGAARRRLEKAVQDDAVPTAKAQYEQLEAEKGSWRALYAIFKGTGDDADIASESRYLKRGSKPAAEVLAPEQPAAGEQDAEQPATELIDVHKGVFRGKLLRISDPSRVYVGVSGKLGGEEPGKQLSAMVKSYGAIAGVNASGFDDPNGLGTGGTPLGLVISQGEFAYGYDWMNYEVIGFDKKNKLHCGYMTGKQAKDLGMRDAVCFGPILISDGKKVNNNGQWSGYNPRTVIAQTEDGTVLILLIEGRQISSIGATYDDVADLLLEYGAVNAGNMDGGASSAMVYNGEQITISSSLNGSRDIPSCWLVAPEN